jgi:hypothetical protein
LLTGRVLVMPAKAFVLSKHTYGYDVKNTSTQDSIGLYVIFNEFASSASYLLGTDDISFCEFLYCFYISFLINPYPVYCSLKFWEILEFVFFSLPNKAVINLLFAC